jgi:hypothetical protein
MSSDENLAMVQAICGDQASMWLEMAGGNAQAAVQLFLSMTGGADDSAAAVAGQPSATAEEGKGSNPYAAVTWANPAQVPQKWSVQGFQFQDGLSLKQHENGPCGVLAVVHAECISGLYQAGKLTLDAKVTDEVLAQALTRIIARCRTGQEAIVVTTTPRGPFVEQDLVLVRDTQQAWANAVVIDASQEGKVRINYEGMHSKWDEYLPTDSPRLKGHRVVSAEGKTEAEFRAELLQQVTLGIGKFLAPGGVELLLYSCVATRTVAQIK